MKATFVGGRFDGQTMDVSKVWDFAVAATEDYSAVRTPRHIIQSPELDNQPIVNGYCGPMWNGDGLRYESRSVYLSYCQ